MDAPKVYVSEVAFLQLLVSSVEIYSSKRCKGRRIRERKDGEAFGYVFGSFLNQKERPLIRVEFLVPCQRVQYRSHTSVEPCSVAEERILSVLSPFPGLELLGTFHSHLYYDGDDFRTTNSVKPSQKDNRSWKDWWDDQKHIPLGLELIIGIQELQRRGWAQTQTKGNCIEGIWEKIKYAIGAWYTTQELSDSTNKDILKPVHWLICPTAFGITREDIREE